ncbi:MAG: hypothetical protein L0Y72_18980 [Gemmataceae bacterium]|nr:hypothetical protein [Gemmataceae bacterium]MCI0741134.1 hypothetical protein [Gemmataceae bacterium]
MAKDRQRDDDYEEDDPPRRRSEQDEGIQDRPAQRRIPRRDDDDEDERRPLRRRDDDEDDDDDRPRRRRSAGLIPYKNGWALAGYYCGMGGLIVILGSIALAMYMVPRPPAVIGILMFVGGGILALLSVIFGGIGIAYANKNPDAKGMAHAIIGLVLGVLEILGLIVLLILGLSIARRF